MTIAKLYLIALAVAEACIPPSRTPPEWEMFREYADYEYYDQGGGVGFEGAFATSGTTTTLGPLLAPGRFCGQNIYYRTGDNFQYNSPNEAAEQEYPWVALLTVTSTGLGRTETCVGTILSEIWIVSTASCLMKAKGQSGGQIRAYLGMRSRTLSQAKEIRDISLDLSNPHPQYASSTFNYDIAMMRMTAPLNFSASWDVQRICLPDDRVCRNSCLQKNPSTTLTVVGWGKSLDSDVVQPQELLQKYEVALVDKDECRAKGTTRNDAAFNSLQETMICSDNQDTTYCQADTGSPLMCKNNEGNYELAGVALFGQRCPRSQFYGTYTKLCDENFIEILDRFIQRQMN